MGLSEKQPHIAIVGLSGIFPEAKTVREFWNNILNKKDCIREVGNDREGYWKVEDYFDPDPDAPDKTYSKKAGFLPEIEFDPMEFGIPPINMESISTAQLFSLFIAKQAFKDSDILNYSDRDKIGVVLGSGEAGNTAFYLAMRTEYPKWKKILSNCGLSDEISSSITEKFKNLYPEWQENSMPGFLGNVTAGRITNYFNLSGANYTLNAACATSLAAVKAAMNELKDGSCDAVLTGGIGIDNSILAFMSFTKTPVISPTGCSRPYDADADGMMLGDAVGMMVLKRLEDAERDGDRIYAVIRGIGSSSDGKSTSIYAPSVNGQVMAMEQAYENAGCSPSTIQLVEGHGTATVAGDFAEFQSISKAFGNAGISNQSIALGSVKSQIGHGRVSAGASSLIKTIMALYHKTLPPTINVENPNPKFNIEKTPFYLNTEPRPWFNPAGGTPRRAAVSSFGFGGTNFHIVLEEYQQQEEKNHRLSAVPEMLLIYETHFDALLEKCETLLKSFSSDQGGHHYHEYVLKTKDISIPKQMPRLGFVAKSLPHAIELLHLAIKQLKIRKKPQWDHPKGIFYRDCSMNTKGRIVALFPGQGSQYLNMCSELVRNYPIMRHMVEDIDVVMHQKALPGISEIIYPPPLCNKKIRKQQEQKLVKSENAQPAIGAISAGLYELLQNAGFTPDFAIGHSFGELTALWAAGVIEKNDFIELEIERGQAMAQCSTPGKDAGTMLAVAATETTVSKLIADVNGVKIANYNSQDQFVIAGATESIHKLHKKLKADGKKSKLLPVSAAFHTPFVQRAQDMFATLLEKTAFNPAAIPVFANKTGKSYPKSTDRIKKILSHQISSPVLFQQAVESAYKKGGDLFVEIGPGEILTNLTKRILKGKPHIAVALNPERLKDDEFELRKSIVRLIVTGLPLGNIDPYRFWETPDNPEEVSKKRLSVTLNGGAYLNPKTRELSNRSLYEKKSLNDEGVIEKVVPSKSQPKGAIVDMSAASKSDIKKGKECINSDELMESLDTSSKMHLLYQKNQEKYLDLLTQIYQYQNNLMEKFHDSPHLPLLLGNIEKTYQLIEANQPYYHTVHGEYLRTRYTAPTGQPTSVNVMDTSSLTEEGKPEVLKLRNSSEISLPDLPMSAQQSTQSSTVATQAMEKEFTSDNRKTFLDPDKIVRRILQAISTLTNHPVSRIDLNADLEIDLGIDMMKAIDILTLINEEFSLDETILEEMIELRTMNEITLFLKKKLGRTDLKESKIEPVPTPSSALLKKEVPPDTISPSIQTHVDEKPTPFQGVVLSSGSLSSQTEAPIPDPPSPVMTKPTAVTPVVQIDSDEMVEQILEIISEKTGYPTDMLEMDMDLIADLGVDSIKIVQILGTIQEKYPDIVIMDPDEMENMELRTIGQVADYIRSLSAEEGSEKKKSLNVS